MKAQTRTIKNKADAEHLIAYVGNMSEFPFTATIKPGVEKRTDRQNRMQHKWYSDAETQGDMRADEYRAYCKLYIGCKILYQEDDDFREAYNRVLRGMDIEKQLALMLPPFSFPVTSLMNVKQKCRYLDEVWQHFRGLGFQLTDPAMMGIDQYNNWKETK